jgi:hypothetical protein
VSYSGDGGRSYPTGAITIPEDRLTATVRFTSRTPTHGLLGERGLDRRDARQLATGRLWATAGSMVPNPGSSRAGRPRRRGRAGPPRRVGDCWRLTHTYGE